jgi:TatD DNase family protein
LPLVIHQRKAENEVHEVLHGCHGTELRGVFHCFSGSVESARRVMAYEGFFVGIGGIVTFKNAKLGEVLRAAVPLERVVLETDCPYLAPVPHRGERNESSFLTSVCGKLAEIYNLSPGEVEKVTDDNARRLFGA